MAHFHLIQDNSISDALSRVREEEKAYNKRERMLFDCLEGYSANNVSHMGTNKMMGFDVKEETYKSGLRAGF